MHKCFFRSVQYATFAVAQTWRKGEWRTDDAPTFRSGFRRHPAPVRAGLRRPKGGEGGGCVFGKKILFRRNNIFSIFLKLIVLKTIFYNIFTINCFLENFGKKKVD